MLLKLKFTHWIIIALIVFSGYQYYTNTLVIQENLDLKMEKKGDLRKLRDSAFTEINRLTVLSKIKVDSLILVGQKIKYIPYEKLIYDNRNLDDALNVISDYRYNKGATATNQ